MAAQQINELIETARAHHRARRTADAEAGYRQALKFDPNNSHVLTLFGLLATETQRHEMAVELLGRAIELSPNSAEAHYNLGLAQYALQQFDAAAESYRRALALQPDNYRALGNLGSVYQAQKNFADAISCYEKSITLRPDLPGMQTNLAAALRGAGRGNEAEALYRRVLAAHPGFAMAWSNLGNLLQDRGAFEEAVGCYQRAVAAQPNFTLAFNSLGNALSRLGDLDAAIAAYGRAAALQPELAYVYCNIAYTRCIQRQFDRAMETVQIALELNPNMPDVHNVLGNIYKDTGESEKAVESFRRAVELNPAHIVSHSNLVYSLLFHPGYGAAAIRDELDAWQRRHAEPLHPFIRDHDNDRTPNRRLRIGYVSPDFRDHVVGRNFLPLIREHNREQFEVFCYSNIETGDPLQNRIRSLCAGWRSIGQIKDEVAAETIRNDGIDILVDLSLHMADNRLTLFARKPAPVQATFMGYPGSTGLRTVDYRLTDPYLDPAGMDETVYSERTIRLADSFWCYDREGMKLDTLPPVSQLPAGKNGYITFGCLNSSTKVNEGVLRLWARVLREVDGSKLFMLAPPGSTRVRTEAIMAAEGVHAGRIEFAEFAPRDEYLSMFQRIDIVLDTFPYNGHTTSLDGMWMGAPVVTLIGKTVAGRAGFSQLSNLGLQHLAAKTEDQFVQIASETAGNIESLSALRASLRERMLASPLMNASKFARSVEVAYRQMWQAWCAEPMADARSL